MDHHLLYVTLLALLLSNCHETVATEVDLTVDIDAGYRECMYQTMKVGVTFEVEYQVIDGGELDINFVIQSPSGRVLITDIRKTDNVHQGQSDEEGDYAFCMDNTFSRFSNKVVFFELVVDDESQQDDSDNIDNFDESMYDVKLEDFKDFFTKIKVNLEKSVSHQKTIRAIESRSRSFTEHNFERVNFWSGILMFVMVSVALVHVLMIRGLFEDRGKVHKIMKMAT